MGDRIVETRLDNVWVRQFAKIIVDEFSNREELLSDHLDEIKTSLKNIEEHLQKIEGELKQ